MHDYIHFYGTDNPELFEIERRSMDRKEKVIQYLEKQLPRGRIADIGAGDGFTAKRLLQDRNLICIEPSDTLPNFAAPVTLSMVGKPIVLALPIRSSRLINC